MPDRHATMPPPAPQDAGRQVRRRPADRLLTINSPDPDFPLTLG